MGNIDKDQIRRIVEDVVQKLFAETPQAANTLQPADTVQPTGVRRSVALGADHGGFELKEQLKQNVSALGFAVIDCGTHSKDAVDYPDLAALVGRKVAAKEAFRGVLIDGAGIGSCMAANKISGVRAALCYDKKTILNSRFHNNANVLCLGAPMHTPTEAAALLELWLGAEFEGGRHQRRVDKIMALESQLT